MQYISINPDVFVIDRTVSEKPVRNTAKWLSRKRERNTRFVFPTAMLVIVNLVQCCAVATSKYRMIMKKQ